MIEPTNGRVVWYHHPHEEPPYPKLGDQPFAAHIAFVHSERQVNLLIISHTGHAFARENLLLLQEDDAPPVAVPYAEWMPYQKGQTAKTEALQAQIPGDAGKPAAHVARTTPVSLTAAPMPQLIVTATAPIAENIAPPSAAQAAPQPAPTVQAIPQSAPAPHSAERPRSTGRSLADHAGASRNGCPGASRARPAVS